MDPFLIVLSSLALVIGALLMLALVVYAVGRVLKDFQGRLDDE